MDVAKTTPTSGSGMADNTAPSLVKIPNTIIVQPKKIQWEFLREVKTTSKNHSRTAGNSSYTDDPDVFGMSRNANTRTDKSGYEASKPFRKCSSIDGVRWWRSFLGNSCYC